MVSRRIKNSSQNSKTSLISDGDFSLKLEPDYLIKKFNQCINDLNKLSSNQSDDIFKLLDKDHSTSNDTLHEISNQIKNLLKVGYTDGKERSEEYSTRTSNFYNYLQRKKEEPFSGYTGKTAVIEKLRWHRTKAKDYLDELILIKDSIKSKVIQPSPDSEKINEEPLEIDVDRNEFHGIMHVFVSHKFVTEDQELALSLKRQLRKNNIEGYLAEQKREFDIPINQKIRDKIDESDYLIAIITKFSLRSPSVHQEIGYALGSGCPIRIMVETEEVPGVLVKDREIEEFTRINFEKKLDIIINNIIDKGPRKKIKSKDPQLIQNVYEPCYNQMMNVYGDEFITSIPPNPWDKISHSWRLKTEPEIKNLFKNYSKELTKWSKMSINFGNQFQSNNKNIAKFLEPIFEKFDLIKEGGRFDFGGSNHDAESWLFNCQDVIFNENIPNAEELYQILKKNSMTRWGDRYAITYDVWKKDVPEIYDEILKMIPKLIEVLGARYSYKEIDEQRNILKKCIDELTLALEEKLK